LCLPGDGLNIPGRLARTEYWEGGDLQGGVPPRWVWGPPGGLKKGSPNLILWDFPYFPILGGPSVVSKRGPQGGSFPGYLARGKGGKFSPSPHKSFPKVLFGGEEKGPPPHFFVLPPDYISGEGRGVKTTAKKRSFSPTLYRTRGEKNKNGRGNQGGQQKGGRPSSWGGPHPK